MRLFLFPILLSQLAACGVLNAVTERPFGGAERAIEIGHTTRSDVHGLLGTPYDQDAMGNWEAYRMQSDGIRVAFIVPYSKWRMWTHYVLIAYGAEQRVEDLDAASEKTRILYDSFGHGPTVYAGGYGYHTFTDQVFPSIDGGGEADSAWADYLTAVRHHKNANDKSSFFMPAASDHEDTTNALRTLCTAARREHPCAFKELGDLFAERPLGPVDARTRVCGSGVRYLRSKTDWPDDVQACVWYSMANRRIITSSCRAALSPQAISRVRSLLLQRRPDACERAMLHLLYTPRDDAGGPFAYSDLGEQANP